MKIGILAFGSLIEFPGKEIEEIEIGRIECVTPFNVEFARISSTRGYAPTLIPIFDNSKGLQVNAIIIIIDSEVSIEKAKSILWRRECHVIEKSENYKEPKNPTSKNVMIGELDNFCNVEKVIFTYFIIQEDYKDLNPLNLADYAIKSAQSQAGKEAKDGISYLISIKKYGIITEFGEDYEKEILNKTNTTSLENALKKLIK